MRIITLTGLLIGIALSYAQSQSVLNVTGATISNASMIVEYSIGEVAIATIQNTVTQGLLQHALQSPYVLTDTDDSFDAQYGFRAYPNPTTDFITVETAYPDFDAYQILNVSGKVLQTQVFDYTAIPVSNLNSGMYLIQLISKDKLFTKTFKVIKP